MGILIAALSTIMIEGIFWGCFRDFRNCSFLVWSAVVNLLTNVTLNLVLLNIWHYSEGLLSYKVLLGEVVVVIVEYLLLSMIYSKNKFKLFYLTGIANVITFSLSFFV